MDLALERRIDTDLETLYLTDATPLDDDLLDPVLAEIAAGPQSQSCEFWVRRIAEKGDCLHAQALARLEAQGIMESDDGGLFAVAFRVRDSRRYPAPAGVFAEQEIRSRLLDILFNDDVIPSPRDTGHHQPVPGLQPVPANPDGGGIRRGRGAHRVDRRA